MSGDHNQHQKPEGCAECGKKSSDGWALYCVKCIEAVREWQGLTDEEIMKMLDYGQYGRVPAYARNFVDAIEAALKAKNA